MMNTAPPITINIMGPNRLNKTLIRRSASCCWCFATRLNISSSSPLDSPLAIICNIMGGKLPLRSSALERLVPSLTFEVASLTRSLSHAFDNTSPAIRIASTNGTPDEARMLNVLANWAVLVPRDNLPTIGSFRRSRCHLKRTSGIASIR